MATKKKVEQPANYELQQILEHFGEKSAEYRFALMQIEPTKIIYNPEVVSKESIDNLLSTKTKQTKSPKSQIFVSDEAVEHFITELSGGAA